MDAARKTLAEVVASVDVRGNYTPEQIAEASRRAVATHEKAGFVGRVMEDASVPIERRKHEIISACVRLRNEILKAA